MPFEDHISAPMVGIGENKIPNQRHFLEYDWPWIGRIIGSLPAVCGLVSVPLVAAWLMWVDARLVPDYTRAAAAAAQAGDGETMLLAYQRLVRRNPQQEDFIFGLAQASLRVGRREQAQNLLRRLTPENASGHAPARLWSAQQLLTSPAPTLEEVRLAERQLRGVLVSDPDHSEAHRLLCRILLDGGRWSEAEPHLEKSPLESRVDFRLQLARGLVQSGESRRAESHAKQVEAFYAQRLFRDPDDNEARLFSAEALTLQGRHADSVIALEEVLARSPAPATYAALGGTYLAWAQSLDIRTPANRTARDRLLDRCVTALKQGPAGNPDVDRNMASAYILLGKLEEAEPYLQRAVEKYPGLLLEWARLHGVRDDDPRGVSIAKEALQRYADALRRDPQSEELRILMADAEFMLRRYEAAVATLQAGITTGRETRLQRSAAKVLVGWFDALKDQPEEASRTAAVKILKRALEFDPWNSAAVQRLEVSRARWKGGPNPAAEVIDELLATGEPPAIVLATLGAGAKAAGELDRARGLLERAYALEPDMQDAADNLAWVLAHEEKPDLDRALEIVSTLIKDADGISPPLLATRGEIYAKLANWQAARRDLEGALPTLHSRPGFHSLLAEVYDQLQEPSLAKYHRELAEPGPPMPP